MAKKMNKVVKILMERDDMTEQEAKDLINECREDMQNAIESGDYEYAEACMSDYLGLEPDYIFDILL